MDYNYDMQGLCNAVMEAVVYAADKVRDTNGKSFFESAVLCAQFLRDNLNIPILKNVQPEDIEDISERYWPYLGVEYASDIVKKIRLRDENGSLLDTPLFLISLTEHKSDVDYDVSMQLLKYMVGIWQAYAHEQNELNNRKVSKNKSFRYPPILPIVYYEGKPEWTAVMHLKDRIMLKELFEECIPDFKYELVRIHDYDNEELLARKDEMSLIMLFNKIQNTVDLAEFLKLPKEEVDCIIKDTPEHIIDIIARVMKALCIHINASVEETEECIRKVRERNMDLLFANAEKMDIQAERRNTAEARRQLEEAQQQLREALWKADKADEEKKELEKQLERQSKEQAILVMIENSQELGADKERTIKRVTERFQLSREAAEEKMKLYWKDDIKTDKES